MRLLVVEDNEELSTLLVKGLDTAGFPADIAATAGDADHMLSSTRYSAAILDLGLPDEDGASLVRKLRLRADPTPVLVLTARNHVRDRVSTLSDGADDYLVKPFAFEELVARLHALLRRPGEMLARTVKVANVAFNTETREVAVDGQPAYLSGRELALLELLMRRSERVIPKKLVEDHIFGLSKDVSSNAIEVYIYRLRKQLADLGAQVEIHTIRGVGYLDPRSESVMRRTPSILRRIIYLHVAAIGAVAIVLSATVYVLLTSTATRIQDATLREHASVIAQYLTVSADGQWALTMPPDLKALYDRGYNGNAFAVIDTTGRVLFSSFDDNHPIFASDPHRTEPTYFQPSYFGRNTGGGAATYYGISFPIARDDRTVWVQVAQDLGHPDVIIDDIVVAFFYRFGAAVIPILLLLLAIDIVIVRRALRPVSEMSALAAAVGPARLDIRLPAENLPAEIVPLVTAVNQAFDRLERGFQVQRQFVADAAHELRTPLTLLRMRIDMLTGAPKHQLVTDIERMIRIANQLLTLAELESIAIAPTETADLRNVSVEVVAFLAPLALAQNKNIALTGEEMPVWINGNAEMLFQALRNVTENAINHTAAGTTVEVDVQKDAAVRILDHGPGIPEPDRALIFRRFWRRDRRRPDSAGLGLSIVARIVEAHGGRIVIEGRPEGGTAFILRFNPPAA